MKITNLINKKKKKKKDYVMLSSVLFIIKEQKDEQKRIVKKLGILISLKNYEQNLNIKNCADLKFLKHEQLTKKNYEQSILKKKKKQK